MKKKLFTLFFALTISTGTLFASNTQVDGIWYNFDMSNLTAEVTYKGASYDAYSDEYSGEVNIPASIVYYDKTYSVTCIGDYAFMRCTNLTSVTIPNNITSIGNYAFNVCTGLTSITIPNSVISIGNGAFNGCAGLTSIEIPNSVTLIDQSAFRYCTGLTSVEIPNSVTSIGSSVFSHCTGLTSITIPNSVISIGSDAFSDCTSLASVEISNSVSTIEKNTFAGCSGLTSITIPSSVTTIGTSAFSRCSSLDSVTIDNGVRVIKGNAFTMCTRLKYIMLGNRVENIENEAFSYCYSLTSITIPNSMKSFGSIVFYNCNKLVNVHISDIAAWCSIDGGLLNHAYYLYLNNDLITDLVIPDSITNISGGAFNYCILNSVSIEALVPPTIGASTFKNSDCPIYVPCNTLDIYKSANMWSNYAERIQYRLLDYKVTIIPSEHGQVNAPVSECDQLIAMPDHGYHFMQWNDGNTENPRTITLTHDTTFTAEFAVDKSGMCGENNALTWSYDDNSKTLTITGSGALTDNYTFGVEAPTQMNTLVISNEVTAIGDSAFYAMTTINHLIIGSNVASIGKYAFAECKNFDDITCYATTVPSIDYTTFYNVGNKYYIYLYVPKDRERAYKRDVNWGQFDIQVQSATSTTTTDEVTVVPAENTATVTWPAISGAASYDLVIKDKEGNDVCTLIFNAQGQLISIAFNAPARGDAPRQTQASGFSFTVTGLKEGTRYDMTLTAKNDSGGILKTETISFHTNAPEGLEDVLSTEKATKLFRDGQILILRGDKTFTLQGQEVR